MVEVGIFGAGVSCMQYFKVELGLDPDCVNEISLEFALKVFMVVHEQLKLEVVFVGEDSFLQKEEVSLHLQVDYGKQVLSKQLCLELTVVQFFEEEGESYLVSVTELDTQFSVAEKHHFLIVMSPTQFEQFLEVDHNLLAVLLLLAYGDQESVEDHEYFGHALADEIDGEVLDEEEGLVLARGEVEEGDEEEVGLDVKVEGVSGQDYNFFDQDDVLFESYLIILALVAHRQQLTHSPSHLLLLFSCQLVLQDLALKHSSSQSRSCLRWQSSQ